MFIIKRSKEIGGRGREMQGANKDASWICDI